MDERKSDSPASSDKLQTPSSFATSWSPVTGIESATPANWRDPPTFVYETRPSLLRQATEEVKVTSVLGQRETFEGAKPVVVPYTYCNSDRVSNSCHTSCLGVSTCAFNLAKLDPMYYYPQQPEKKRKKRLIEKLKKLKKPKH